MERFVTRQLSKLVLGLCMLMAVNACKKNDATPVLSGNYKGSYIFSESAFVYWHGVGTASIALTDDTFSASNLTISPVTPNTPVITNGNYKIKGDSVEFSTTVIPPGTGIISSLALTGKYQYHFEGDSLILTKQYSLGELSTFSQYRLKRN